MPAPERLFTARFALMFGFSFTVFLSAFQLLPTAPFHILALGGTSSEAGLFLAFLTYASALCAPFMGGVADRLGKRRILFVCSLAIAVFSALYAVVPAYQVILALVPAHGLFWAGLLSASVRTSPRSFPQPAAPRGSATGGLPASLPSPSHPRSGCGSSSGAAGPPCAWKRWC